MAVPRTPASEGFRPTPRTPDWATARPRYLPMAGPFTGQALWVRVVRHARCADDSRDPRPRFPVSVQIEARQEVAAAIAACTICSVRAQAWRCRSGAGISASAGSGAAWSPPNLRPCAVSCAHRARYAPACISYTARRSWYGGTGPATGQVAGVGDLAEVTAATGAGTGLADASRITPRS